MNADQYIQKLIELSTQKLGGLREILRLTEEQGNVITEDNADELQRIIELKQQQMDIIDELDQAFEVYYSRLKSLIGVQSLEEIRLSELNGASVLKQTVSEVYDVTRQIQVLEDINNKKVRDILDKLSGEIRQIKQAQKVNNGYNIGAKLPQQSYYFDKKK